MKKHHTKGIVFLSFVVLLSFLLSRPWQSLTQWQQHSSMSDSSQSRPSELGNQRHSYRVKEEMTMSSLLVEETRTSSSSVYEKMKDQPLQHNWVPPPSQFTATRSYDDDPCTKHPLNVTEINMLLNQPPWLDFDWRGVDGKRHAACGWSKCYLTSRTNPTIGYLIAIPTDYQVMVRASQIQNDLRNISGGTAHVLEIPGQSPQLLELSPTMACLLQEYVHPHHGSLEEGEDAGPTYTDYPQVAVHQIRRAPDPHIMIGFSARKKRMFLQQWPLFLQQHHVNATGAFLQLKHEFANLQTQIFPTYPDLVRDFQGIVDVHGRFYHMDVDRIFKYPERPWQRYMAKFEAFVPEVLAGIEQITVDYERGRGVFAENHDTVDGDDEDSVKRT